MDQRERTVTTNVVETVQFTFLGVSEHVIYIPIN